MPSRIPAICTAVALILTPAWLIVTNPAVPRSHPLLPSLLAVSLLSGLLVVALLLRSRRRDVRVGRRRAVLQGLAALLVIGVMAALTWLAPFPFRDDAGRLGEGVALADVGLVEDATSITLVPTGNASEAVTRGLVFYPGARVEALAYIPLLAEVAREGTLVVVLKEPLGISLVDSAQAGPVMEAHPEVVTWAVGGHSLGGVSASIFAAGDADVSGLLLWASYPLDDLSGSSLEVLSVSGSEDGLSTRADITASRELLPAGARFTEVPGGVHAFFGDYGHQPGDGVATAGRDAVQADIIEATLAFIESL